MVLAVTGDGERADGHVDLVGFEAVDPIGGVHIAEFDFGGVAKNIGGDFFRNVHFESLEFSGDGVAEG